MQGSKYILVFILGFFSAIGVLQILGEVPMETIGNDLVGEERTDGLGARNNPRDDGCLTMRA